MSERKAKLIAIDEQPDDQIMHALRLGKANRTTNQPLNPSPKIDVLAFDFLCIRLAHFVLVRVEMPLVSPPPIGGKFRDAKRLK